MPPDEAPFRVDFYQEADGTKPVAVLLKEMIARNHVLVDPIQAVLRKLKDPRWHRAPYTKDIGDDLFEARIHNSDDARLLFFHGERRQLVVVHLFVKKGNKLPERERSIALSRMKRWHERNQSRGGRSHAQLRRGTR